MVWQSQQGILGSFLLNFLAAEKTITNVTVLTMLTQIIPN
jgi:hypothetical protein